MYFFWLPDHRGFAMPMKRGPRIVERVRALGLLTMGVLSACAPAYAPSPTAPSMVTPTPAPSSTAIFTATAIVTPQATATPNLANFRIERRSFTSPNGEWEAQTVVALPAVSDTATRYYVQLKVSKTDGTIEWIIVDKWSEWGLGYTIPQPLHWSHDGRYLYFTNKPVPDGCAVFVNGSDLHRVDLNSGEVVGIIPPVGLWLSLSPDETMLAYIGYGNRGLVIRDLATGMEREVKLNPGEDYQAGHILWSPDGRAIILALAIRPCSTDWAESTSIVRVDVNTLELMPLLQENKHLFIPVEWATPDQVLLKDKGGDYWLMDATTGQVVRMCIFNSLVESLAASPVMNGCMLVQHGFANGTGMKAGVERIADRTKTTALDFAPFSQGIINGMQISDDLNCC
ncbi:MAG TPA: hypothetical protein VNK89_00790 [Thermoflexus sp.]|nr:hypothetical protein [Thermoflexus sp.]